MKQHRFWAWGAVICLLMVMITGYKRKYYVMETVTTVQENASDILASAKDLNEERAAKEAEEAAAAQLETSEEE